jgi:hypothetical protein
MTRESEFVEALRSASIKSAAAHLKVLQRLKELEAAFWLGEEDECDDADSRSAASKREAELANFLFDIARLHLNAYNIMLGASSGYTDQVVKRLRRILTPDKRRRDTDGAKSRQVSVAGKAGEKECRSHSFTVTNPHGEEAQAQLLVSKFRAKVGEPFAAKVDLLDLDTKKGVDTMGSHEERDLILEIDLADPSFVAGGRYDADAEVRVGDRIVRHLTIHVDVS